MNAVGGASVIVGISVIGAFSSSRQSSEITKCLIALLPLPGCLPVFLLSSNLLHEVIVLCNLFWLRICG